jgi:hypothetical protein
VTILLLWITEFAAGCLTGAADAIKDQIVTGILNEVCEYFAFDEEEVR